jgi:Cu+-exporting ATPase
LQTLGGVDLIAFDKTGTLTEGRPAVTAIEAASPDDLLRVAAAVEAASEHPLARAIVAEARARGLPIDPVSGSGAPRAAA